MDKRTISNKKNKSKLIKKWIINIKLIEIKLRINFIN